MGTTLTAFVLDGDTARFAHIGDSRAYLLRDGELQPGERRPLARGRDGARRPPDRSKRRPSTPTAASSAAPWARSPQARIDEFTQDLLPGDVLLLCSDGLSGPVSADAMKVALTRSDPQASAERLILEARKQGGPDNITAVVVHFDEGTHVAPDDSSEETTLVRPADPEDTVATGELPFVIDGPPPREPDDDDAADALAAQAAALRAEDEGMPAPDPPADGARKRKRSLRRLWIVAAVLALLAAALAAGAFYLSTVFYVGVDDGTLTIFSGVPAEVGPVPLHAVYRRSYVDYDALSPAARTLVDEQKLRDKQGALDLGTMLGMFR